MLKVKEASAETLEDRITNLLEQIGKLQGHKDRADRLHEELLKAREAIKVRAKLQSAMKSEAEAQRLEFQETLNGKDQDIKDVTSKLHASERLVTALKLEAEEQKEVC